MRNLDFQTGEFYHIYNRGVDKRNIFLDHLDYIRFIESIREFNRINPIGSLYHLHKNIRSKTKEPPGGYHGSHRVAPSTNPLVKIVCYSLLPNHYHFLIQQLQNDGIPKFMHKIGMGHTHHFNAKNNRSGSLFQGRYKAKHIASNSYLWWLSCYINANIQIHKINNAEQWIWSSYQDYLGLRNGTICDRNIILKDFKNIREYKNLTNTIIKESRKNKNAIKSLEE